MSIKVSSLVRDGPGAINDNTLYIIVLSVAGECRSEPHTYCTFTQKIKHTEGHEALAVSCEQSLPIEIEKLLWESSPGGRKANLQLLICCFKKE